MLIPVLLAGGLAALVVLPPLRRRADAGPGPDLVFAALAGSAALALALVGHFEASALFLAPAGVLAGAATALASRAVGLPALGFVLGIGLAAFGAIEFERAHRGFLSVARGDLAESLEARDRELAARLATRTADERVALCVFDGRTLAPEDAAAVAVGADVEAAIDLAADDGPAPGHEALRAESAFAVAELPLFALAALDPAARTRGFTALRPRPYVEVVLAPDLPTKLRDLEPALKDGGKEARASGARRLLVMGGAPAADSETAERLRRFVRDEGFVSVLHPVEGESRAVRDGETTWVGIGAAGGGPRPVRIVVEPFGVEAERLAPRPRREGRGPAGRLRFAGAWARRGLRPTLVSVAALAGIAALLATLLGGFGLSPARDEAASEAA